MNKWLGGFFLLLGIPFTGLTIYALNLFVNNWDTWYRDRNISAGGFEAIAAVLILSLIMCLFVDITGLHYLLK